ncbi:hypothetical protein Q427_09920 [Halomonas sp. BC04]|nr:hypothetical protein Q427_09920 [Halomonas sp. BC04]
MTPHLIVSDLDGTLLDANHDLHPHTIETLRALAELGHHLAFARGGISATCWPSASGWACLST